MTDRPIIFSAPMVKALIAGRKSQTRRILKPQPDYLPGRLSSPHRDDDGQWVQTATDWQYSESLGNYEPERESNVPLRLCYAPGDRLYVREACDIPRPGVAQILYRSDHPASASIGIKWHPSIHMPRWVSRLTMTVTDVRVERLNDISEADAWAEGCRPGEMNDLGNPFPADEPDPSGIGERGWDCAGDWFADLWNTIHGPEAWDANPWVVAISFDVRRGNIDMTAPSVQVPA